MNRQASPESPHRLPPVSEAELVAYEPAFEPPRKRLVDYLPILYRRRWAAVATLLLVVGATAVYTFSLPPVYEAHAQLLMVDDPNVVSFKDVVQQPSDQKNYYQTQYRLLQSRSLARDVLDKLHLWKTPPFGGTAPVESRGLAGAFHRLSARASHATASIAQRVGLDGFVPAAWRQAAPADTGRPAEVEVGTIGAEGPSPVPETTAQSIAISRLLASLTITPIADTNVVEVRYSSQDPRLAANIVNALTDAYIEQNLGFKFRASQDARQWLDQQLAEQQKKVEASERELQGYRERSGTLTLGDGQNMVLQRLNDLNQSVTRARTTRIEKEALYKQLLGVEHDPSALDSIPAVFSNGFIQSLKSNLTDLQRQRAKLAQTLGPKHPSMLALDSDIKSTRARLQTEVGKLVEVSHQDYLAAQAQEDSLAAALDDAKQKAQALNRQSVDYGVVEKEAESNREIYQSLLQRANETAVSAELKVSNVRVVDPAEVPNGPVSPRVSLNMLVGTLAALVLAVFIALILERWDNRIKLPGDVATHLGVPFFGMLPRVPARVLKGGPPLINNGVPPAFAEAFRAIRTNVLFSSVGDRARSLVVTSSTPGEGKSTVAANLAIALAKTGKRVLLIDGDMRQPTLHTLVTGRREPGLSNILVGTAKPSVAILQTRIPSLWLLPSGRCPPNPSELLGSKRFEELFKKLTEHFDWVILDAPPVLPVTDAAVLAQQAGVLVFVVNASRTRRQAAQTAIDRLEAAGVKVSGVVLNGAEIDRHPYYYGHYYGHYNASDYPRYAAAAGKS